MFRQFFLKMDGASDDKGGGGGAATGGAGAGAGAGDSGAGGGGGLLTDKGAGAGGAGADKGGAAAGSQGGAGDSTVKYPENWKLGLPKELQEDSSLKVINDIPALVKSYIHAQKAIGADKIVMPSKHATPEEWRNVQHQLGLPKEAKDYKVNEMKDSGITSDFIPQLAAKAHEIGILPQHAQALADWLGESSKGALGQAAKDRQLKIDSDTAGLKKDWGQAYDQEIQSVRVAIKHFASPEEIKHLEDTGLTHDPVLAKIFNKVSKVLNEDQISAAGGKSGSLLSPAAAIEAIALIQRDMKHPYYQKDHPNHGAAMAEMTKLMNQAYPN